MNTIRAKHLVPARVHATVERFAAAVEAGFARNLRAGRERGELGEGVNPLVLVKLLTSLNFGLVTYGIVLPEPIDRAGPLALREGLLQPARGSPGRKA